LQGRLAGDAGAKEIREYLRSRVRLTVYAAWLGHAQPLAMYSTKLDDFLHNDPVDGATAEALRSAKPEAAAADNRDSGKPETPPPQKTQNTDDLVGALTAIKDPAVRAAVEMWKAESASQCHSKEGNGGRQQNTETLESGNRETGPAAEGSSALPSPRPPVKDVIAVREIAIDGSFEGLVVPGRRIGGLAFGLDLPVSWTSMSEPAQAHSVEITRAAAHSGVAGLHFAGATDAALFQWVEAGPGRLYDATVFVRGRVSPGTSVALTLGWLDSAHEHVGGYTLARLPEGEWNGWVRLRQGGAAPADARFVGIGVRVQHQASGDWVDVDDFSLKEATTGEGARTAGEKP
jgi:hypothetical protein